MNDYSCDVNDAPHVDQETEVRVSDPAHRRVIAHSGQLLLPSP